MSVRFTSTGVTVYSEAIGVRATDALPPDAPVLHASPGDNRVLLAIDGGNRDGDLAGYVIER